MDDSKFEEWVGSLTILGDEAVLPGEFIPTDERKRWQDDRVLQGTDWVRLARSRETGA